jgi:multidrug efflux pump subunit AcrA (membrane-fusion protein)
MNAEGTNPDRRVSSLPKQQVDSDRVEQPQPQPPQKGISRFFIPALIGLLCLGGIGWVVFTRFIAPLLGPGAMAPPPTQVGIASLKSTTVSDSSDYAATLDSRQSVILQPRVAGQISAIYVKAGDRVNAGDPILQIDATEQRAQVASRDSAAETAAADITVAQADVASARDTLRSLQARRVASQSDVELNRSEYQRYRDLYNQGASSQQVSEQKLNAIRSAQASLAQVDAEIRAQQAAIARAQATVVRNQRALQQAQANVSEGEAQLQYYTITAPFAGIMGDISAKVGDFVDTSTKMLRVTQNRQLEVQVAIPLERAPDLRQGLPVQLLDEQNKVLETGKISFIAPDVDPATQSVQAKAVFSNAGTLRTAQFVRVRMIWATHSGILVPATAISRLGGRDFVFVAEPFQRSDCQAQAGANAPSDPAGPPVKPDQMVAVQKPIKLGKIIDNDQEVIEGLNATDRIVVSGILNLQNCVPIAPATPVPKPQ